MGLNGSGPRDWSPDDAAPGRRRRSGSGRGVVTASSLRHYDRAPRAGAWAPLVFGFIALVFAVTEYKAAHTTSYLLSTIGLIAVFGGISAHRKIAAGHRGSRFVASASIVIGALAVIIMVGRFVLMSFAPTLAAQLPLVVLESPERAPAQSLVEQPPVYVPDPPRVDQGLNDPNVATTDQLALSDVLLTTVSLIAKQPFGTDLTTTALVNGLIVLPDGSVVIATNVRSLKITTVERSDHFTVQLVGKDRSSVSYDSNVGLVELTSVD